MGGQAPLGACGARPQDCKSGTVLYNQHMDQLQGQPNPITPIAAPANPTSSPARMAWSVFVNALYWIAITVWVCELCAAVVFWVPISSLYLYVAGFIGVYVVGPPLAILSVSLLISRAITVKQKLGMVLLAIGAGVAFLLIQFIRR